MPMVGLGMFFDPIPKLRIDDHAHVTGFPGLDFNGIEQVPPPLTHRYIAVGNEQGLVKDRPRRQQFEMHTAPADSDGDDAAVVIVRHGIAVHDHPLHMLGLAWRFADPAVVPGERVPAKRRDAIPSEAQNPTNDRQPERVGDDRIDEFGDSHDNPVRSQVPGGLSPKDIDRVLNRKVG